MGARVVHFEIHASNPDKAIEFYSQLFGWKFQAWGPPGMYWLITTGDDKEPGINGGLVQRRGENPADKAPVSAFVCTVSVDNAKEMVERATSLGASIALPLQAVPGVGWLAYIKDA